MSKSKEHSYRFNREMTRAVLDGRKTQTRRLIKPQPPEEYWSLQDCMGEFFWTDTDKDDDMAGWWPSYDKGVKCPYGDPGDTFRLSEAVHVQPVDHERYSLLFEADLLHTERYGDPALMERIRGYKKGMLRGCTLPPAFCRSQRWEITRRWVERIQDISEEDAIKEGIRTSSNGVYFYDYTHGIANVVKPQFSFMTLWQSIYGPESWERNDWVWVTEWKEPG